MRVYNLTCYKSRKSYIVCALWSRRRASLKCADSTDRAFPCCTSIERCYCRNSVSRTSPVTSVIRRPIWATKTFACFTYAPKVSKASGVKRCLVARATYVVTLYRLHLGCRRFCVGCCRLEMGHSQCVWRCRISYQTATAGPRQHCGPILPEITGENELVGSFSDGIRA